MAACVCPLTLGDHSRIIITSVLQPFVDCHELAGAVTLVLSPDKVLSLGSIGFADISARKPMATNSLFWIASISKPIAAAALMMLVDEGKVRLDDPVEKYLTKFEPRIVGVKEDGVHTRVHRPQPQITLRHLLSHTAGLPATSSIETPTLDVFPLSVRVESYALDRLMFAPGSDFTYSNAGINTAAHVIEMITGMPYEEFLQKRLFSPLGMTDTTFWPSEAQQQRLARSYKATAGGNGLTETIITQLHYPLTERTRRYPIPAGGLFSAARDLARFCQMLLSGGTYAGNRLLSEAAIREMSRNQLSATALEKKFSQRRDVTDPIGYGLGFFIYPSGVFGHAGAYHTNLRVDPEHGLATVWLVQHANFPGDGDKSRAAFEKTALGLLESHRT
jgi:CubicO group peptidase (beta-lactamase class C family)